MHWFLVVVASTMGNEENLPVRLLPRVPTHTQLLSSDVFLARSTIPGSACMRAYTNKTTKSCVLLCVLQLYVTMYVGCYSFKNCILNDLTVSVIFTCRCILEQCAYGAVSISHQFDSIKFVSCYQTAGFGVFAGRAFRKGEVVLRSCMTLYLPRNFPRGQAPWNYAFRYNKTHIALDVDHGSIFNHLESANTIAKRTDGQKVYQVRRVFNARIAMLYEYAAHICMHAARTTDTRTHQYFEGHNRYRGRTGTFYPVRKREVV